MSHIQLKHSTTPPTPSATYTNVYADTDDGLLKQVLPTGAVTSPYPISLTASQIASPSVEVLADVNVTYQLDVAPHTRYQSTGSALVAIGTGGAAVATNLGTTTTTTVVTVTNDNGTDATLPAATTTTAGVMTAADKVKLNGAASVTPTVTTQTGTTYTLQPTDAGTIVRFTNTNPITVTVPAAFSGLAVRLVWESAAGVITIVPSGTIVNGSPSVFALSNAGNELVITPTGTANSFDAVGAIGDLVSTSITDSTVAGRTLLTSPDAGSQRAAISAAQTVQTFYHAFYLPTVVDGVVAIVPMDINGTITKIIAQSTTGTCTLTCSVNNTPIGGGISSVTDTKSSVIPSSSNTFLAGNDISIVASATSSCTGLRVTIAFTRTLVT